MVDEQADGGGEASRTDTCAFCRIVAGQAPAHLVVADGTCTAFLDVRPLFPGHTLVVPDVHHETLPDLSVELVALLFTTVRRVAAAVESALGATGSFVAMNNRVSQSVAHVHVHVVPRNPKDGLRGFFWPRQRYDGEGHAAAVAAALRDELARGS